MKNYDAVIIGFGKGGKTLAGALAKAGKEVALIEKSSRMYGGTCINVGCIPSKSLVTSAEKAAEHNGENYDSKAERYRLAIEEKRRVTSFLRQKNYEKLNSLPNVTVIDGEGRFVSPKEIEIVSADGSSEVIRGEKIFINTGARPVIPSIKGVENNPKVYYSEDLMDEEKLPERLTIIGAGYIGMEFASMYNNFGSKVTVLQYETEFLPREDSDVSAAIMEIEEKRGVRFIFGAKTLEINGASVVYEKDGKTETLDGDAVLVATGRRPNTDFLQAEKAGVELEPRGAVRVDAQLRTTAPDIWALGDVNGGPQFTFVSLDDYRIVLAQLNGGSKSRDERQNVPYSVFMNTPLGRVGLTENQAKEKGLDYRVVKLPTAAVPKAQVLKKTDGFLKAVIDNKTGHILGASLLCTQANEMINLIELAMNTGSDYKVLRDMIYTHPTMTEAFNDLFSL